MIFTMPHKAAALPLVDEASEVARRVGAINAARRDPAGRWEGEMFDGQGFVRGLRRHGHDARGRRAALLGAGGAGRAIAFALAESGIASISVHELDRAKAIDARRRSRARVPRARRAHGPAASRRRRPARQRHADGHAAG